MPFPLPTSVTRIVHVPTFHSELGGVVYESIDTHLGFFGRIRLYLLEGILYFVLGSGRRSNTFFAKHDDGGHTRA